MMQFYILLLITIAISVKGSPVSTSISLTELIHANVSNLAYQNSSLNTFDPLVYANTNANASDPELEALIKKKKKLIPKWQYNAGIYLEKKVNKKLLKKAGKGGFALMSSNGNDSTYTIIDNNEVEDGSVFQIPSSLVVARASPNTHSLFAENVTDYKSIHYTNTTDGAQFQETSKDLANGVYEDDEESSSNSFSYNPQTCFLTVLLVAFCLL